MAQQQQLRALVVRDDGVHLGKSAHLLQRCRGVLPLARAAQARCLCLHRAEHVSRQGSALVLGPGLGCWVPLHESAHIRLSTAHSRGKGGRVSAGTTRGTRLAARSAEAARRRSLLRSPPSAVLLPSLPLDLPARNARPTPLQTSAATAQRTFASAAGTAP